MTTITSSTSVYSVSSIYSSRKTDGSTSSVLDLMEEDTSSGSNSSRSSVKTASTDDDSTSSSSASLKLSGQLWDLMSSDSSDTEEDQDSIDSQSFAYEPDGTSTETSTEEEFLSLSSMTLAERIRQQYLDDNDLTEDDLKAMDAEQRAKIEDEIQAQIQAATKELQGMDGTDLAGAGEDTTAA